MRLRSRGDQVQQVRTGIAAYLSRLKACISSKDLAAGMQIHADAVRSNAHTNIFLANGLLDMYAKCGSMGEARKLFESMPSRTAVSWTFLMRGYIDNGAPDVALEMFSRMQSDENSCVDDRAFGVALSACTLLAAREAPKQIPGSNPVKLKSLKTAMALHSQATQSGRDSNIFLVTKLIQLYSTCGSMIDARSVFDKLPQQDLIAWTALITGYTANDEPDRALDCFFRIQRQDGYKPDGLVFVAALNACSCLAAKEQARQIEGRAVKMDCLEKGVAIHSQLDSQLDIFVATALVDMYAKCGSLVNARRVFDLMPAHNSVTCAVIVQAYAEDQAGGAEELALEMFFQMNRSLTSTVPIYIAALKACIGLAYREQGRIIGGKLVKLCSLQRSMEVHSEAMKSGTDSNTFVANTLINLYAKCGSMEDAARVFSRIQQEQRTVVSWTALIVGYAENGLEELALDSFWAMLDTNCSPPPDGRIFMAVLGACSNLATKETGKKCGGEVVKLESLDKGMAIHSRAAKLGFSSDMFVASTLVDMYSKCGSMADAQKVFNSMPAHNVVSWTALILGYAESGDGESALESFSAMIAAGCEPDSHAFNAALRACGSSSLVNLELVKTFHAQISRRDLQPLATGLVHAYSSCGSMAEAQFVFDSVAGVDSDTLTALIAGYSRQGDTATVFRLFRVMEEQGLRPDGVLYLCLLTACSHAGMVDRGRIYFRDMVDKHGISPGVDHFTCMVDLFGRANQLHAALDMIVDPRDAVAWRTLLAACSKWKNVEVGRIAFQGLLNADEKDPAAYSLMKNILCCSS